MKLHHIIRKFITSFQNFLHGILRSIKNKITIPNIFGIGLACLATAYFKLHFAEWFDMIPLEITQDLLLLSIFTLFKVIFSWGTEYLIVSEPFNDNITNYDLKSNPHTLKMNNNPSGSSNNNTGSSNNNTGSFSGERNKQEAVETRNNETWEDSEDRKIRQDSSARYYEMQNEEEVANQVRHQDYNEMLRRTSTIPATRAGVLSYSESRNWLLYPRPDNNRNMVAKGFSSEINPPTGPGYVGSYIPMTRDMCHVVGHNDTHMLWYACDQGYGDDPTREWNGNPVYPPKLAMIPIKRVVPGLEDHVYSYWVWQLDQADSHSDNLNIEIRKRIEHYNENLNNPSYDKEEGLSDINRWCGYLQQWSLYINAASNNLENSSFGKYFEGRPVRYNTGILLEVDRMRVEHQRRFLTS